MTYLAINSEISLKSFNSMRDLSNLGVILFKFFNISIFFFFISCLWPQLSHTYLWIFSKFLQLKHYLNPRGNLTFYSIVFFDVDCFFLFTVFTIISQSILIYPKYKVWPFKIYFYHVVEVFFYDPYIYYISKDFDISYAFMRSSSKVFCIFSAAI